MLRKGLTAVCIAVIASLLGSGLTFASEDLPTWEVAFDPVSYLASPYYMVHAVEEYKGDLYAVAGDPGWLHWGEPSSAPGQVFRSPDGKNWEPASEPGFGLGEFDDICAVNNAYETAWDMAVFQDKLYVLPYDGCYTLPGVILRSSDGDTWESVATTQEFGLTWTDGMADYYSQFHKLGVFQDMLYVNVENFDMASGMMVGLVYRSPTGASGSWERVLELPGWGSPGSFHVFKGALYIASDSIYTPYWEGLPEQIWRTFDGVNWEMVVGDGFGNPASDGLGGFADYKGYLYVGASPGDGSGQVWRSQDGLAWEPVVLDGFGNPLNEKIDGLVVYLGDLYAYTLNWVEGCHVYRTKDGLTWVPANEPGWGNPTYAASHLESAQAVFKDELYMGIVGPQGVVVKMLHPDPFGKEKIRGSRDVEFPGNR